MCGGIPWQSRVVLSSCLLRGFRLLTQPPSSLPIVVCDSVVVSVRF